MNLKDFIIHLGQNPYKLIAAKENPYAVMEEAGLSETEQEILTSGDMQRIAEAIEEGIQTGVPILS
jgi:hypothetical protein